MVDSFDAMMSNRTYRNSLGLPKTVEELQAGKNKQFDGNIVDAFLEMIQETGEEKFREMYCSDGDL